MIRFSCLFVIVLCLNAAIAHAQTVSTQATVTPAPTFGSMLNTFPGAVLSTISSVIARQTTATMLVVDSTGYRKDNVALQMGLLAGSRAGAGA